MHKKKRGEFEDLKARQQESKLTHAARERLQDKLHFSSIGVKALTLQEADEQAPTRSIGGILGKVLGVTNLQIANVLRNMSKFSTCGEGPSTKVGR